jgi:hypothetical protein
MTIFVHIPKNGGMSVRRGCPDLIFGQKQNLISQQYCVDFHNTMVQYGYSTGYEHARWRDFNKDLRERNTAFAAVRNPWERTASRYTFAVKCKIESGKGSFMDFLNERHVYADKPFFWHRAVWGWYPQKDYVVGEDGKMRCDIIRTEHLTEDLEKYTGVRYKTRHNISDTGRKMLGITDWRDLYGDEEYDIVADWYKEDIEFFGFDFNSPARNHLADCLHTHATD